MFQVNPDRITSARTVLAGRRRIIWIIGGAAAGKSTISRAIAAGSGLAVYDMDERIYGSYGARYTAERHPANTVWLAAESPLAWALSLSDAAFDAFGRATTAEYLDLLAEDLGTWPLEQPLLIDGGITHPSIVAQVLPPQQLVCLTTSDEERVRCWETAEERAMMREWIGALPDPAAMWRRFLAHDAAIAITLERESRACGIPVLVRGQHDTVADLAHRVAAQLGVAGL